MGDGSAAETVNEERDEDSGKFASKYTDEDFLDAIGASGGAAGTTEIADAVGCPQRTAYHRLDELRDAGDVSSRKVGGSMLWMLADE